MFRIKIVQISQKIKPEKISNSKKFKIKMFKLKNCSNSKKNPNLKISEKTIRQNQKREERNQQNQRKTETDREN
jgi:ribosomal protein L14E/L6E/L27E